MRVRMPGVFSKRSFEGYLEIDHRDSPGISQELSDRESSGNFRPIPAEGGKKLQLITKRCSHCPRIVIMRPERTRARGYCPKCDGFVCDDCELKRVITGVCRPWKQIIDEWYDAAAKGQVPKIILP